VNSSGFDKIMIDLDRVEETPPDIADVRKDYLSRRLRRANLHADPIVQFSLWLEDAFRVGVLEPNAMSLATAWKDGQPLVRTVLLKGVDARGFVFFTNLESRKARQLAENPKASLLFPWLALERQVIATGSASRLPTVEVLNTSRRVRAKVSSQHGRPRRAAKFPRVSSWKWNGST
jgi:pyridoxamine-phosphate oxidase